MIWETPTTIAPNPTSACETLTEEVLSLCATAGEGDSHELRELAAGVARHAATLTRPAPGRGDLSRLTARALGSLGRQEAGRRVLVFGTGMVRSAGWLSAGNGPACTLDLQRLVLKDGDLLELALFRGLDLVIDAIAGLWEPSSGAGLLALRRVESAARLLLGPRVSRIRLATFRREIRAACENRLAVRAAVRGWSDRPRVLFADPETP